MGRAVDCRELGAFFVLCYFFPPVTGVGAASSAWLSKKKLYYSIMHAYAFAGHSLAVMHVLDFYWHRVPICKCKYALPITLYSVNNISGKRIM